LLTVVVEVDRAVSKSLLVIRQLLEVEAPAPPEHLQLLGRVQVLLPRDARFVRVRETFMFRVCALVDRPMPAAVVAMVQGCLSCILRSTRHFMHASFRDVWTVGFPHAVSQFVTWRRSWAYGRSRAVLAPALDLLNNLHEPFLVLAQACGLIRIFIMRLISSCESILSAEISWSIGSIPPLHRQQNISYLQPLSGD
jgi:hypothetical protein